MLNNSLNVVNLTTYINNNIWSNIFQNISYLDVVKWDNINLNLGKLIMDNLPIVKSLFNWIEPYEIDYTSLVETIDKYWYQYLDEVLWNEFCNDIYSIIFTNNIKLDTSKFNKTDFIDSLYWDGFAQIFIELDRNIENTKIIEEYESYFRHIFVIFVNEYLWKLLHHNNTYYKSLYCNLITTISINLSSDAAIIDALGREVVFLLESRLNMGINIYLLSIIYRSENSENPTYQGYLKDLMGALMYYNGDSNIVYKWDNIDTLYLDELTNSYTKLTHALIEYIYIENNVGVLYTTFVNHMLKLIPRFQSFGIDDDDN